MKRQTNRQKTQLQNRKRTTLTSYCIMIVSKFFNSIYDFFNVELCSPKFKGNMKKFHFNPIELSLWSKQFFPNIETLHIYNSGDNRFRYNDKIFKRIIHYKVDFEEYLNEKDYGNQCMYVYYTARNREIFGDDIPQGVKMVTEDCFQSDTRRLKNLTIASSVEIFPIKLLANCTALTKISIPGNWKAFKQTLFNLDNPDKYFTVGPNLKVINGQTLTETTILYLPKTVNQLTDSTLEGYTKVKHLVIPPSVVFIDHFFFTNHKHITSIDIPTRWTTTNKNIFGITSHKLFSVHIPSTLCRINGQPISSESLTTFTLPSHVTSLGDNCFANCSNLKEINGFRHVKEIGINCFLNCPRFISQMKKGRHQLYRNLPISDHLFHSLVDKLHKKVEYILFDSDYDFAIDRKGSFYDKLVGKDQILIIVTRSNGEFFGGYVNETITGYSEWTQDPNAKLFTFGYGKMLHIFSMKRQHMNNVCDTFKLYDSTSQYLFNFGSCELMVNKQLEATAYQHHATRFDYDRLYNAILNVKPYESVKSQRIVAIKLSSI